MMFDEIKEKCYLCVAFLSRTIKNYGKFNYKAQTITC